MRIQHIAIIALLIVGSGCLQTRSDAGAGYQSQVYRKKNIENQNAEAETATPKVDERDELIRALNGRVESLENQIQQLHKEKDSSQATMNPDSQKIALLQDALGKMELQLQKLEGEKEHTPSKKSSDANLNLKKESTVTPSVSDKKQNAYVAAEELFQKKEWKKAILSFQSFVEESPKNKLVPEAKYKIGVCFQELGLKDEASAFYEEVLAQYPKSESGKKAKIRLASLNSKKAVK
jgi:TolA-binding protein